MPAPADRSRPFYRWSKAVLLASGYSSEFASGTAGDFEVLAKPYGVETLAAALARAVERTEHQIA